MTTINIQNLKCGGCVHTITTKVSEVIGISDVTVNVEDSSISFNFEEEENLVAVKQKLTTIGYPAIGEKNSVLSKAKSFVSCATGKLNS